MWLLALEMLGREAGAVQILGKILVPAQESQHVPTGEDLRIIRKASKSTRGVENVL